MAPDRIRGDSGRRFVILDTSAIFMVFEYTIDLEQELTRLLGTYRVIIPSAVVDEINILLEQGSGKQKQMAKMSLKYISRYHVDKIGEGKMVDDIILSAAKELSAIVVTNDRELRRRLKKKKLNQIFLRQKQYLIME